jgi:hypothetical protein
MASAFQTIVDIYLRNRNRKAIEESLAHRRKLTSDLKSFSNADHLALLAELAQEIDLLDAGLKRLDELAREAADQSSVQVPTQRPSTPAELEKPTSEPGQRSPEAPPETALGTKQVEILLVDISSAAPGLPDVVTAEPVPHRAAPVQIVGLTITDASFEAADGGDEHVDGNRAKDLPA